MEEKSGMEVVFSRYAQQVTGLVDPTTSEEDGVIGEPRDEAQSLIGIHH